MSNFQSLIQCNATCFLNSIVVSITVLLLTHQPLHGGTDNPSYSLQRAAVFTDWTMCVSSPSTAGFTAACCSLQQSHWADVRSHQLRCRACEIRCAEFQSFEYYRALKNIFVLYCDDGQFPKTAMSWCLLKAKTETLHQSIWAVTAALSVRSDPLHTTTATIADFSPLLCALLHTPEQRCLPVLWPRHGAPQPAASAPAAGWRWDLISQRTPWSLRRKFISCKFPEYTVDFTCNDSLRMLYFKSNALLESNSVCVISVSGWTMFFWLENYLDDLLLLQAIVGFPWWLNGKDMTVAAVPVVSFPLLLKKCVADAILPSTYLFFLCLKYLLRGHSRKAQCTWDCPWIRGCD